MLILLRQNLISFLKVFVYYFWLVPRNLELRQGVRSALQSNFDFINKIERTIKYWLHAMS